MSEYRRVLFEGYPTVVQRQGMNLSLEMVVESELTMRFILHLWNLAKSSVCI